MSARLRKACGAMALVLVLVAGCASLPENFERPQTCSYTDTADTILGQLQAEKRSMYSEKSGFHLLSNGLGAFSARA